MKIKRKKYNDKTVPSGKVNVNEETALEEAGNPLPGYPIYPAEEDIFNTDKEETDIDPENITSLKAVNEPPGRLNEKDFKDDVSGSDLDIPGAELDDALEEIGSEDEENNIYSIGGDNHNDLEERKGI